MRTAYAITAALLLGGTATATLLPTATGAQTAQNEPAAMAATAPRPGAPVSFADLVAKLQPAVVNISTSQRITQQAQANPFAGTPFENFFGQQGQGGGGGGAPVTRQATSLGSGFIISADGYVVTNNHVVAPGAKGATVETITVTLTDRKEYTAKLIGRDEDADLALLKIDATGLPFVRFGDSAGARVGDWVVAIGNPFGLGGTVTAGIVSAVHRSSELGPRSRFIQTDAAINQGNSGGPMFDLNGNVIGINSQILGSQSGGNIGIGFAIPAEEAKPVIEGLRRGQPIKRGYIGIGLGGAVDSNVAAALGIPPNRGELVASVEPTGPAAKAGLRAGDVVTRVNGTEVTPDATLAYLVAAVPPGQNARLDVLRNGRAQTINVGVVVRPSSEQLATLTGGDSFDPNDDGSDSTTPGVPAGTATLGLTVQPLTAGIARSLRVDPTITGVVVAQANSATDAGQKLKRGDVVSQVNGEAVQSAAEFAAAVSRAKAAGRPQVLLRVTRQRITAFFAVRISG